MELNLREQPSITTASESIYIEGALEAVCEVCRMWLQWQFQQWKAVDNSGKYWLTVSLFVEVRKLTVAVNQNFKHRSKIISNELPACSLEMISEAVYYMQLPTRKRTGANIAKLLDLVGPDGGR